MTTANKITMLRIVMIPIFMIFLWQGTLAFEIVALILFCVASFTDFLDGYIARKYNQITNFGKFVDPVADKLLIISALCIFVGQGRISSIALFIVIARELMVTCLRIVAIEHGSVIAASMVGKVKTVTQIAGVIIILLVNIFTLANFAVPAALISDIFGWLIAGITLISGIEYLVKNWAVVSEGASGKKS